jgi:hypothetical protein
LELLATGRIESTGQMELLGAIAVVNPIDLAVNGELLALAATVDGSRQLILYDINPSEAGLQALNSIVGVNSNFSFSGVHHLTFSGDLLEWCRGGNYYNLKVPLLNTVGVAPKRYIRSGNESLALQVAGSPAGWDLVTLEVRDAGNAVITGDTRLLGNELQFQVLGDVFETGERYRLSLFNPPQPVIDGGQLVHDLPWYLTTDPYFGEPQLDILRLSPAIAVAGQLTQYAVDGSFLNQLDALKLNEIEVPDTSWIVTDDGARLQFQTTVDQPGVYTLSLQSGNQRAFLPAALLVVESLTVSSVETDSAQGPQSVSNSGGTTVTVFGSGFEGGVDVHWLETGVGLTPGEDNRIRNVTLAADHLTF